ncbi:MAG: hypothetical protein NXY57DRAFT_310047 [Lentinula lateritia]|nr:MAG: hypothetical protein NXY57DRAFT_310047 [Lentinula lateritia]
MQYRFLLLLKLGICSCLMCHRLLPIWASLCIADTQSKHSSQQSLPIELGIHSPWMCHALLQFWESQLTVNTFGDLHWDPEALRPSSH